MSRDVATVLSCDSITSRNSEIVIDAAKRLQTSYIKAPGSDDIVSESTINLGGSKNLIGANLIAAKYMITATTEPIVCNSNFEVGTGMELRTDSLEATTPAGTIVVNDNLRVLNAKKLQASLISSANLSDATDWVNIEHKLKSPWTATNIIEASTNPHIACNSSLHVAEGQRIKVNEILTNEASSILTDTLEAANLTLQSNGRIEVDMGLAGQSIQLFNPVEKGIDNTLKPLVFDPADNKIKTTVYSIAPSASRSLVEFFTMSRFETVPYTTISLPTVPSEVSDIIRFLIPSDFQFVLDSIPGMTATETTTYQNGYIYSDTGVWKMRSTDLGEIICTTAMPKDRNINGGLLLSQTEDKAYDIHFSLCKPWFFTQDATAGFRFECWFAFTNIAQGQTCVALVSAETDATNPLKFNGNDPLNYFQNSIFLFSDPTSASGQLQVRLNKSTTATSHSLRLYSSGITPVSGRLIKFTAEWTPQLGGLRVRVEQTGSTTYQELITDTGFLPNQSMFMPLFCQTRKASQTKTLWINRLIINQFNA